MPHAMASETFRGMVYCTSCEVRVRPQRHSLRWWFAEVLAWFLAVGLFLIVGCLAPVALILVALPLVSVISLVGPVRERATEPPWCPRCHRVLVPRTIYVRPEARLPDAHPVHV